MITLGKGDFKLEFKDWAYVGLGAVVTLAAMVAAGWGAEQLRKQDERNIGEQK